MQQAYQEQVCNENGGYEQGMNDANTGKPMDQSFARGCEGVTRDTAQLCYRKGYNAGLAHIQAQKPSTEINVNFGNSSTKNFYCEVHAFTKTFSAWGGTELEARVKAKNNCTEHYNEMHCNEIECKH